MSFESRAERLAVREVGPRDGLQAWQSEVSTEDAVHLFHESGLGTGIDLDRLIAAAHVAQDLLGGELPGQVMKAGPRSRLARAQ